MSPIDLPGRVAFALAASPLAADTLCHTLAAGRRQIVSALFLLRSRGMAFPTGQTAHHRWALTRAGLDQVEAAMKRP